MSKRGIFTLDSGETVWADSFSYYLHTGVDPGNLEIIHTCGNSLCVNPQHLELGKYEVPSPPQGSPELN